MRLYTSLSLLESRDRIEVLRVKNFIKRIEFLSFSIFLLELFVGLIQAPWDLDAHHDGIMYAAAVGSSEGLIPNHEYFAQYGPVTPFIQGIYLHLTSPSMIDLRIFTAITIALLGMLIFASLYVSVGPLIAGLISGIWTISSPRMHAATLPWSSLYSTLCVVIALLIFKKMAGKRTKWFSWDYLLLGVFLILGMLNRINILGAIILLCLFLMYKKLFLELRSFLIGAGGTFLVFNILFLYLNALKDFYYQCVIWAFGSYSTAGYKDWKGLLVNYALYLTLPFFTFLFILISKNTQKAKNFAVVFLLSVISIAISNLKIAHQSYLNPSYLIVFLCHNYQSIFSYAGVTLSIILLLKNFTKNIYSNHQLTIWVLGSSVIFQLYPTPDLLHLWWAAPIGLISAFQSKVIFETIGFFGIPKIGLRHTSIIIFIILSLVLAREVLTKRFEFQSHTLQRMTGTTFKQKAVDLTLIQMEKLPLAKQTEFNCVDGIYAGAGGKYLARNKDFVNWSPGFVSNQSSYRYYFFCNSSFNAQNFPHPKSWKLIFDQQLGDGTINFLYERTS